MIGITDCQNNDEMDFYRYTDSVFIFKEMHLCLKF